MCFFNSCCRPCCPQPCPPRPFPPMPPVPPTPIVRNFNLGAQFDLIEAVDVATGNVLPLTNTVFNNATNYVINNNGTITLVGEGLYKVEYAVNIINDTDGTVAPTINFLLNSVKQDAIEANASIATNSSATIGNHSLVSVANGSVSTIALTCTATATLSYLPNIVITKLS